MNSVRHHNVIVGRCVPYGLLVTQALDEVMAFVLQQQANGDDVSQEDIDDVREAGRTLIASLDDFLSLAPPEELRLVEKIIQESSSSR